MSDAGEVARLRRRLARIQDQVEQAWLKFNRDLAFTAPEIHHERFRQFEDRLKDIFSEDAAYVD